MNPALVLLAALVLEDGRRWGSAATAWQMADAEAVLDQSSSITSHFLTRPRGGSKTSDLAGMLLAVLIEQVPPGARCYAVAADRDQGRLILDALSGFVRRTPGLAGSIDVGAFRATVVATGAVLEILAADGPSAYGLLPHFLVVDEVAQWASTTSARQVWEAVVSSVPKVAGCRLVVLTSAGDPVHWSAKVLAKARKSKRWRVNEVAGPVPWADPGALEEQRALLTESQYARLHLNIWTAAEDRLVSPEDLAACVTLDGPQDPKPGHFYVLSLDVGLTHDRTVVAVAHAEQRTNEIQREGEPVRRVPVGVTVVLDRMMVWQGSHNAAVQLEEVEQVIAEAAGRYRASELVFDPYQAAGLTQRLQRRGLHCIPFTFSSSSVGKLGLTLHTLLRNRAMALPDDAALLDELAHVRLRETIPGVYRIDHDSDRHDDRAVALALAAQELLAKFQARRQVWPQRPKFDNTLEGRMAAERYRMQRPRRPKDDVMGRS